MTFEEFIVAASSHLINTKSQYRMGQAYMTSLQFHRPDLYAEVVATSHLDGRSNVNPYHNDEYLPNFLGFVASRWDKGTNYD